ncbi:MAG: hypothetical protein AAF705_17985, partial [Bacteroidota bacterium]
MTLLKTTFILTVSFFFSLVLKGQHPYYEKTYSPDQLKADLASYRQTLETVHAGLYWYAPKQTMDSLFDITTQQINQDMTERDFYNKVAMIAASINCGHTGTIVSSNSRNSFKHSFPFEF